MSINFFVYDSINKLFVLVLFKLIIHPFRLSKILKESFEQQDYFDIFSKRNMIPFSI